MTTTPYVCRVCGAGFSGPYIRCIGADGKHRPTIVIPRESSARWRELRA